MDSSPACFSCSAVVVSLSVPLSVSAGGPHTPSTSSLASTASWKAGSGSGDGVSGLSVAGDDLLLLRHTHRRRRSG